MDKRSALHFSTRRDDDMAMISNKGGDLPEANQAKHYIGGEFGTNELKAFTTNVV